WHERGAQHVYSIDADLSTFGKGMANGFAVAALIGKREIMEQGGLHHDRPRVFLLSTTHGAETASLAAAREVLRIYLEEPVIRAMEEQGERLKSGVNDIARELGITEAVEVAGRPTNLIYVTRDAEGRRSQPFRTLFMQEMIKRGILGPSFVISYSHRSEDVDRTIEAASGALRVYARALEDGVEAHLEGPSVRPVFRRLN